MNIVTVTKDGGEVGQGSGVLRKRYHLCNDVILNAEPHLWLYTFERPTTFHTSCGTISQDNSWQTGTPTLLWSDRQFPHATQVSLSSECDLLWTEPQPPYTASNRARHLNFITRIHWQYAARVLSANEKQNTLETSQREIYSHRQKKQNTTAHKASTVGFCFLALGQLLNKSDVLFPDIPKPTLPPRHWAGIRTLSLRIRDPENTRGNQIM